jgi:pentatricopeptide repeat protein
VVTYLINFRRLRHLKKKDRRFFSLSTTMKKWNLTRPPPIIPVASVKEKCTRPSSFDLLTNLEDKIEKLASSAHLVPSKRQALYHLLSTHKNIKTTHITNALLLCKVDLRAKFLRIIESRKLNPPNIKACNSILKLDAAIGGIKSLESRLKAALETQKLVPDFETFCILVDASDLAKKTSLANSYFSKLLSHISSTPMTVRGFDSLIHHFKSSFTRSESIFKTLSPRLNPDYFLFMTLINSCVVAGRVDRALEYVDLMDDAGVCVDKTKGHYWRPSDNYGVYPGSVEVDLRILKNDVKREWKSDPGRDSPVVEFNRVLSKVKHSSKLVDEVLEVMDEAGVSHDRVTRNILISIGYIFEGNYIDDLSLMKTRSLI